MPHAADRVDRSDVHLVVIAKAPLAGRVKTRLTPPYSPAEAAALATAALRDTLTAVLGTRARARTLVLEGAAADWLPDGFAVIPQRGDGLDERLAAAFVDAERLAGGPLLLVGMDTPQLTPALLQQCSATLLRDGTDAVLGLAGDGGWWSMGLRHADPSLLLGVPMSTAGTGSEQLARLRGAGLSVELLPELTDVDDAATAATVAAQASGSRFAAVMRELAVTS
jgi:hypothetical protein